MPWPAPKSSRIWPPFSATLARTVTVGFGLAFVGAGLCRGPEVKAEDDDDGLGDCGDGLGDCGTGRFADGNACNGGGLNELETDEAVDDVAANRDSFDGCWPKGRRWRIKNVRGIRQRHEHVFAATPLTVRFVA